MKKSILLALGLVVTVLTACVLPEKEDPFERLPEEKLETIEGKLFPFSVSVSTRATHRLEQDGKLVGYLASDLVQLAEFEGQEVVLDGVWRNEKMREIFWVESIKVPALMEDEVEAEAEPERFTTKKFTMLVPGHWEYSLAPNGVVYFLNREDPARRVFLTFSVEDYTPEGEPIEPNIAMNGFKGMKESMTDENGKEREVITLFSNIDPKKYVFTATYFFDDFETKKSVFDLLQSFVEGEEAVQAVVIAEQKAKAAAEAEKLALAEAEKLANETAGKTEEATTENSAVDKAKNLISGLLANDKVGEIEPAEPVDLAEPATVLQPETVGPVAAQDDYTNLIDDRAYSYDSNLGFSLKVPFGNWYRNFGAYDGALGAIGVANNPVESVTDVKLWVKVLAKDQPAEDTTELITGSGVTIIKKRNDSSVFEITGPLEFRDTLWSIANSIQ